MWRPRSDQLPDVRGLGEPAIRPGLSEDEVTSYFGLSLSGDDSSGYERRCTGQTEV